MISSIILAAGLSSRMGSLKSLLDWGGEPLLGYEIKTLKEAGADEVIVVLGYRADDIHRKIAKYDCRVMLNPLFYQGRAGSLRIGAKAVSSPTQIGDTPLSRAISPAGSSASLSVVKGRRSVIRTMCPRVILRASAAPTPLTTSRPASRRRSSPRPETRGSGSSIATTARFSPAATIASAHGPVRP